MYKYKILKIATLLVLCQLLDMRSWVLTILFRLFCVRCSFWIYNF